MPTEEELAAELPKSGKESTGSLSLSLSLSIYIYIYIYLIVLVLYAVFTAVKRFIHETKCDRCEATFYLDEHDYNLEAALSAYREDLRWENTAPPPRKVVLRTT